MIRRKESAIQDVSDLPMYMLKLWQEAANSKRGPIIHSFLKLCS